MQISGKSGILPQNESTKLALLSLYALFPLVCYVTGTLIFSRFSLNEAEYREIRQSLDTNS